LLFSFDGQPDLPDVADCQVNRSGFADDGREQAADRLAGY
jgi:hypothetical protein